MRPHRATFALLLLVITSPLFVFSQAVIDGNGTILKIHRFQPPASAAARDASPAQAPAKPGELSDSVAQQINALEQDKLSRTATQKKISSRLLYTARMLQGQAAAPGVPVLHTNLELDEQNNLLVDIRVAVSDDLLKKLQSLGVRIVHTDSAYRNVRALISSYQLEAVASLPEVTFIAPRNEARTVGSGQSLKGSLKPAASPGFAQRAARVQRSLTAQLSKIRPDGIVCAGQGSVTSEGYTTHRVDDACASFGVRGAGVKIGVLSDGVTNLAFSQGTGDLPADVTVLSGQEGSGDEGTAMLEIVHDLAPDAKLYFATAFTSIQSFAQNIRDLRTAGCDIIVDDVFYFVESPFQDGQAPSVVSEFDGGVVIQAANDVVADGAMYFSSAGNNGNKDDGSSGTYENDFIDGGANPHLPGGKVNKFGTTAFDSITSPFGGPILLHWTDPLGGSGNDYDLYLTDSTGNNLLDASTDIQDGTQDPIEGVGTDDLGDQIIVYKPTAAATRFLHVEAVDATLAVSTSGEVHGHAGASGAFAVAATPADLPFDTGFPSGPFPNPFDTSNVIEPYSSDGPRHIFFEADGTAITPGNVSSSGGTTLHKPEYTAADGVSVTGVNFFTPFYGTSAAAPHAAAIAALVKSADNTLTNSEVASLLASTAVDIMGAGTERDSGAGIIMAFEAVQAALSPSIGGLSPNNGIVGTPITISGKNFGSTPDTVTFNGTAGTPTTWTDTSIVVPVPTGATNGNVVVTVLGLASNGFLFTLTPSISGLSANSAPAGASVTITGTNFGDTQGSSKVKFNGIAATVQSWTATSIVATVPVGGTGNVVVTINSIDSNGLPFTVQDFSVPATLTDVTVTAGGSNSQDFTITPGGEFDGLVTFTCSGLPSKSTCTFTPPSLTPAGAAVTVTMKVSTTAAVTSGQGMAMLGTWLTFGAFGLVLGGLGARKRSRKALAGLALCLLLPMVVAITSCGGGSSHTTTPGTPPGTYNITMRATAGPTTHSSTFKLTVN